MTPPLDISLLWQHAALPKQILHGWQNTDSCWTGQNFNLRWQNTDFVQNFHLGNCEAHFKKTAMTSANCVIAQKPEQKKKERKRCCWCWGHTKLWCRIQPSERHVPDPVKESRRWWPSPASRWVSGVRDAAAESNLTPEAEHRDIRAGLFTLMGEAS